MDTDLIVPVISRWAHIGTAIVLVGGTTFFRFVVMPVLADDATGLVDRIRDRWKKFVHGGIALFLISGFYNYYSMMSTHKGDKLYHPLIGTKILLALFVFYIASALVGRSAGTQKIRDNAKKWTGIMLLVSALIIGMSGFAKVRGPVVPADSATQGADDASENGP